MDRPTDIPDQLNRLKSGELNNERYGDRYKDRLHADVQRAVGGLTNLLRETCRISAHLEPRDSLAEPTPDGSAAANERLKDQCVKRMLFLSYELQTLVQDDTETAHKLEVLNHFFFHTHRFNCILDPMKMSDPCAAYRIDRVLAERSGAPMVIELLYAFLAERIGIELDFVDLKPTCFVRQRLTDACGRVRSQFIDVTRSGAILSSDELIETLHTRFAMTSFCNTSLLEVFTFESYISDYVSSLKPAVDAAHEPEQLLFLQNTLISYQPSNLQLVGERALLHRRLGNFKNALADLKRYFAFHDRSRAPVELVHLYDELLHLLERNKTSIEVLE